MFDDAAWEDSAVQGFRFDWDKSDNNIDPPLFVPSWTTINDTKLLEQETDVDKPMCAHCHKIVDKVIIFENDVTFCSDHCWKSVLYTAVDDFSLGGMSAWPLDTFVSFSAKSFLLELATRSLNSSVILKMLRHLQSSLSKESFERLLLSNSVAFNHFLNFLRKVGQTKLLHDLLTARGLIEHAKVHSYNQLISELDTVNMENAESLVHRLNVFALSELTNESNLNLLRQATLDLSELLRFQFENQSEWTSFCNSSRASDVNPTHMADSSSTDLLALPLSETFQACLWMDKGLGPGTRVNGLRTGHKISDDQFHWFIVEPLVLSSNWIEMDSALLEKKWLKRRIGTKLPTDRLVLYLHALNAPSQIISAYLSHSDSSEELIETALRLRLYSLAIQTCVKGKDRSALQDLLSRIPKKRPEHSEVMYYLSTPINQWKVSAKQRPTSNNAQ